MSERSTYQPAGRHGFETEELTVVKNLPPRGWLVDEEPEAAQPTCVTVPDASDTGTRVVVVKV
jgi:hypothetical protein